MNYFQIKSYFWHNQSPSIVDIEVVQQRKIPFLQIIGVGSGSKSAQRERIVAALDSIGERLPSRKFVVQVRGSVDFPRETLDLPIALAILGSANRISQKKVENRLFWGSLSLDGRLEMPNHAHFGDHFPSHWQIIGPKTVLRAPETAKNQKLFPHIRECLSFLRANDVEMDTNPPNSPENFSKWTEVGENSLHNSLLLHLVGGFPLYLENFANDNVPSVVAFLRSALMSQGQCAGQENDRILTPEVRIFRGLNYQKRLRELLARFQSRGGEQSASISLFFELERKISLLHQYWQSQWERGEVLNLTRGWIGFGQSCLCEYPGQCRCRSREIREYEKNKQVIQSLFPLQWKGDFPAPRFDGELARTMLHTACDRSGSWNAALVSEEAFTKKVWRSGAVQAVRFLLRKKGGVNIPHLPQIALIISDFRGAHTVDEADVHEALLYMSRSEISPFVSGTKRSSGSYPERNSTAMP